MIEYPKIETLFDRDERTRLVRVGEFRLPEFALPIPWEVTEKVDGTNIRVEFEPPRAEGALPTVRFGGRTAAAQIPAVLLEYLMATFTRQQLAAVFADAEARGVTVTLFGEGYGARIQKAGGNYRPDPSFRLFDVRVGSVWLEHESREDIAKQLGILHAPTFGILSTDDAITLAAGGFTSTVAREDGGNAEFPAEGIVARSSPLLLNRMGKRVMWKLKARDFAGGSR